MVKEGNIVTIKTDTKETPWLVIGQEIKSFKATGEKVYNETTVYTIYNAHQAKKYIQIEESQLRKVAESEEEYNSRK